MNKYTVSLKLAKQMKELGWEKETLFAWGLLDKYTESGEPKSYVTDKDYKAIFGGDLDTRSHYLIEAAAPIASEILEELPRTIKIGGLLAYQQLVKNVGGTWSIGYWNHKENIFCYITKTYDTPSEALGKMWCHLKKEELI